jgi:hypothetical protein
VHLRQVDLQRGRHRVIVAENVAPQAQRSPVHRQRVGVPAGLVVEQRQVVESVA